jgi:hypothetical protein
MQYLLCRGTDRPLTIITTAPIHGLEGSLGGREQPLGDDALCSRVRQDCDRVPGSASF